jgi:hypothetical protein
MSVSDENAPPLSVQNSKAHNRRRTSSLFELEGTALLDIIGENNLPFSLPASTKDVAIADSSHASVAVVDGVQQQTIQPPAASAHAAAAAANPTSVSNAAAEVFERWDSQPTLFPHPTFIFAGMAAPLHGAHALIFCLHFTPFSCRPLRASRRPSYLHIFPASSSSYGHYNCSRRRPVRRVLHDRRKQYLLHFIAAPAKQ